MLLLGSAVHEVRKALVSRQCVSIAVSLKNVRQREIRTSDNFKKWSKCGKIWIRNL